MTIKANTLEIRSESKSERRRFVLSTVALALWIAILSANLTYLTSVLWPSPVAAENSFKHRMILARFDKNHDGKIAIEEFGAIHRRMFKRLDRTSDGSLSRAEFTEENGVENERRVAGFIRLDRNHDGLLSPDEFATTAPVVFNRLDRNRDGRLTPGEITNAIRSQ